MSKNKKKSAKIKIRKSSERSIHVGQPRSRAIAPSREEQCTLIALFNEGRLDDCEKAAGRFCEAYPASGFCWKVLGIVLAQMGRNEEALKALNKSLNIEPTQADALNSRGNALRELGRLEESVDSFEQALRIDPNYAEAYNNLGLAFRLLKRTDEAAHAYAKALKLRPDYAEAHMNMGVVLQDQGKPEAALEAYQKCLAIRPDYPEAHNNLGNVLMELRCEQDALSSYQRAIDFKPDYAEAQMNYGVALQILGRTEEALALLRKALENDSRLALAHNALGTFFLEQECMDEALQAYSKALEIKPGFIDAQSNLGATLQELGRLDEAESAYIQALKLDPDLTDAWCGLIALGKANNEDKALRTLTSYLAGNPRLSEKLVRAHFALGKLLDKREDYDAAFAHYYRGNALKAELAGLAAKKHDPVQDQDLINFYRQVVTTRFFQERESWGLGSRRPIFIVGMPRSGTSLTEQILASHSKVYGGGEISAIATLAANAWIETPADGPNKAFRLRDPNDLKKMADGYLQRLEGISHGRERTTDKMPHNFKHLWAIALLFPRSTIIHCVRAPEATCLSCYFQNFKAGHLYSTDLQALGRHYCFYLQVMRHWKSVLPCKIHDFNYELLVSNPEVQIRRLLNICELDFEENCLNFYKTKRVVKTASNVQVRQHIYKTSVEKWKHYEKHLEPLLDELSICVT